MGVYSGKRKEHKLKLLGPEDRETNFLAGNIRRDSGWDIPGVPEKFSKKYVFYLGPMAYTRIFTAILTKIDVFCVKHPQTLHRGLPRECSWQTRHCS